MEDIAVQEYNCVKRYCPICHSVNVTHAFHTADFVVSKESFAVYRCNRCGFLMTDVSTAENNSRDYDTIDRKLLAGRKSFCLTDNLYYLVRNIMLRRKYWYVHSFTGLFNGTLVNYGAGTGFFSDVMVRHGWNVYSFESQERNRNYSKEFFCHNMLPVEELNNLPQGCADAVTMWHVLEHCEDPKLVLLQLKRVMTRNGLLFVAMPNSYSLDAEYYKEYWAGWNLPRHLWHFSPRTFQKLASQLGFTLMYKKSMPFDVFYISILSERNRGKHFCCLRGLLRGFVFMLKAIRYRNRTSSVLYVFKNSVM